LLPFSYSVAPKDIHITYPEGKFNSFGLGYEPSKETRESLSDDRHKSKMPRKNTGFGVGILEEEDDDIEIYDYSSMPELKKTIRPFNGISEEDSSDIPSHSPSKYVSHPSSYIHNCLKLD